MNLKYNHIAAVILAAGKSERMGLGTPKHLLELCGDTVIRHTVRAFENAETIDSIVVVVGSEQVEELRAALSDFKKVVAVVSGAGARTESARCGFLAIPDATDMVAIHDGARCLVTAQIIDKVVRAAKEHGAATAGTYATDTVKYAEGGEIRKTLPRENLFMAHTPQVFARELYGKALCRAEDLALFTDDNSLVENIGKSVLCVETGRNNLKLTTQDDLLYAEFLLKQRGIK